MATAKITDFALYRWRYYLGFAAIGMLLAIAIIVVTFVSPGGINRDEMNSVVASTFTPPQTLLGQSAEHIVHLPYRLFQKLSLAALDVNVLSIKLPSIVLSVGAILALYGLLRLWFRRNVAIISSIIAIVTGQFLLLMQLGTPAASYIFWNAAILYSVSMLARTEKYHVFWLLAATTFAALSLYSPMQLYIVIALFVTCLIHPHARFVVMQTKSWILGMCAVWFGILVLPIVLSVIRQPHLILTLLGIPSDLSIFSLETVKTQLRQYIGFTTPSSGLRLSPAYGLGIIALASVGLYRLFTEKYTAKSYILTLWLILLLPLIITNPDAVTMTFIPTMLLLAYGIDYIIRSWYRLFPNNPYARVFGLIPLCVLVSGITLSGIERVVNGYHYDPRSSNIYTNDVQLLTDAVSAHPNTPIVLAVPRDLQAFYTVYSDRTPHTPKIRVISDSTALEKGVTIVHRNSTLARTAAPTNILVSRVSTDADRFYLYKK